MPTPGWQACLPPDVGGWPWDQDSGAGTAADTQRIILPLTVRANSLTDTQGWAKLWAQTGFWRARGRLDRARTWFLPWREMGGLEIHISSPRVVGQYERHASPSPIQSYRSRGLGPVIVFCFTQFPLTFPTTDPEVKLISHLTTTGP